MGSRARAWITSFSMSSSSRMTGDTVIWSITDLTPRIIWARRTARSLASRLSTDPESVTTPAETSTSIR